MTGETSDERSALVCVREADSSDAASLDRHRVWATEEAARYRGSIMDAAGSDAASDRAEMRLVADVSGAHVGSLVAAEVDRGVWMVLWVFTVPEARRIGVGDALMDRFRLMARERGARRFLSRALPGDRETKNLFERHGFTAQMIVLGTSAPEPPQGG